jgi:hypothetical protein
MRTFSVSISCLLDEIEWLFIPNALKHSLNPIRVLIIEIVFTTTTGNGIHQLDEGLLMEFTNKKISNF